MIVEMRTYHCMPGRMPALHERFSRVILGFFEKHGIAPIGFWTTLVGESNHALVYLLRWESLADREQRWNAFQGDSEWIAARNALDAAGPVIMRAENQLLVPTAYSALR